MSSGSRIFVKNRALGYVSNQVPVLTRYIERRRENVLVTCVGRHFHTYGSAHFTLLNVSGAHPEDINCTAADRFLIYTAAGNNVYSWKMGTQIKHVFEGHTSPVHLLEPFASHLISIDESSTLKMWDLKSESLYTELEFDNESFRISCIIHPHTYINKILLGSEQGQLQLWNLHTRKLIYTFAGWQSAVTALEQAPAIDVVAIGLANGRIILHNLRYDKTVVDFSQDWGCVTAISFRTDGPPVMVSGTGAGHILLWDLEKREPSGQMWNAHYAAVTGLQCFPSEPLLVTSSPDNSLKMWIFDMPDGTGRLLKIREGHSLPPTLVKFHTRDQVFTAGSDSSLRVFSTVTETKNHSFGRAVFNRKLFKKVKNKRSPDAPLLMPPIIALANEDARSKEWDDVVTLHRGLAEAATWASDKSRMGDHKLLHARFKEQKELHKAIATCVSLTQCGNFVLIGYSSGHLDRFNMQSGLHRCEYVAVGRRAHKGAVRGVTAQDLNQAVVSGGADSTIRFWRFKDGKQLSAITLKEAVSFFCQQRDSSLLAAALDDNSITIVDIESRNVIRRLPSHTSRLTALEFSPDSRWLLTATIDCLIRTWDVPSAHLVDIFRTPCATVSMSLNSTGEMLATCHVDYLGVFIWSNRITHSHVTLRPLPEDTEAPFIELPVPGERLIEDDLDDLSMDAAEQDFKSPEQISEDLVTLSSLASSRWLNILDIDIIKRKNKPKEAPKASKSAPFFLPTVKSLEFEFDVRPSLEEQHSQNVSSLLNKSKLNQLLMADDGDFTETILKLKSLGPSALDVEVLNLAPEGGGSLKMLKKFISLLHAMLSQRKDFELGQTYLAVFLKHHGDLALNDPEIAHNLEDLQSAQIEGWTSVETKLLYSMSVVQALKRL